MTTQTLPAPDATQHANTFKGKKVAERHALDYTRLMGGTEVGVVFETTRWNGQQNVPCWIRYTITPSSEGFVITSDRWNTNPNEEDPR